MIQPNAHFTVHWYLPKKASYQVIRPFLRNQRFKWKVDDRKQTTTTTGDSALEKLRCLPAGGAKNGELDQIRSEQIGANNDDLISDLVKI